MTMLTRFKSFFASASPEQKLNTHVETIQKDPKKPLKLKLQRYNYRVEAELSKWKIAIMAAEDNINPQRELLYGLYKTILEDDQLVSQVRTACYNIQMGDFEVKVGDTVNEDLVKLFDTPWFFNFLQYCVDTELWGFSLLEFRKDDQGMIKELDLIPREHVDALRSQILIQPGDFDGIPFDHEILPPLFPIGQKEDLGLLKVISKLTIRKEYQIADWGRRNEKFGVPFIVMKTASRDENELDQKENMLRNFGSSGWALADDEDDIEIKEALGNTGGGHRSFSEFISYADKCIAFIVNGTTASSEQVAYVGNAEVQERQLNKYTLARMRRIQYIINFYLFPFLVKEFNYPLANAKFEFVDLRKQESETVEVTQENDDD